MMDTLASEMKDTYLVYGHTTPGNRKVWHWSDVCLFVAGPLPVTII
jgi:hypothetical protein